MRNSPTLAHGAFSAVVAVLLALSPGRAAAQVSAIQSAKLTRAAEVQAALRDVSSLEAYSSEFSATWGFPISKAEVAGRLERDLTALQNAAAANPGNEELLVLEGLTARYAYNLDVPGSYTQAQGSLKRAAELAPDDVRPQWSQTPDGVVAGAKQMLAIEATRPWRDLPVGFWSAYASCVVIARMPAHAQRAEQHLRELGGSGGVVPITGAAIPFDPAKHYDQKEIWRLRETGKKDVLLSASVCGFAAEMPRSWNVLNAAFDGSKCTLLLAPDDMVLPDRKTKGVLAVIAARAKQGESLAQFADRGNAAIPWKSAAAPDCPVSAACTGLTAAISRPSDTHAEDFRAVVLARTAPEFPGLLLEVPQGLPAEPGSSAASPAFYRPVPEIARMPGTIYYMVMLDTQRQWESTGLAEYQALLKGILVE